MVGGLRPAVEKAYCAFHNFSRGHFIKGGAFWLTFCEPHCFEQWAAFCPPYFKFIFLFNGRFRCPLILCACINLLDEMSRAKKKKKKDQKLVNTAIIHGWFWKKAKSRVGTEMVSLDRFLLVSIRSSSADWGHRSRNCWLTFRSKLFVSRRHYFKSAWCLKPSLWCTSKWWEENLSRRKEHLAAVRWKLARYKSSYIDVTFFYLKSFTLAFRFADASLVFSNLRPASRLAGRPSHLQPMDPFPSVWITL